MIKELHLVKKKINHVNWRSNVSIYLLPWFWNSRHTYEYTHPWHKKCFSCKSWCKIQIWQLFLVEIYTNMLLIRLSMLFTRIEVIRASSDILIYMISLKLPLVLARISMLESAGACLWAGFSCFLKSIDNVVWFFHLLCCFICPYNFWQWVAVRYFRAVSA